MFIAKIKNLDMRKDPLLLTKLGVAVLTKLFQNLNIRETEKLQYYILKNWVIDLFPALPIVSSIGTLENPVIYALKILSPVLKRLQQKGVSSLLSFSANYTPHASCHCLALNSL